ncbi:LacI family DNA-binding transcriptional regulator [Arenivirga flava]|uniref:LacI family transcriptional regulator n=1 Tax=Arenivirga flava TaxID=1930060 RepID=A0AA37UID7_9MICO|nr:LacI family DNA-binding transcriptional regulator [Arenivirga flava]GMA27747.1 LacI family transcriptional regulator [Arenivirga flava]
MAPPNAPTVYDVAERAGVSIATVSRVLRTPEAVKQSTRERVLAVVQELGYVPSASARGLAGRRTGALGLFIPGHEAIDDPVEAHATGTGVRIIDDRTGSASRHRGFRADYFDELLRGAELEAWRSGHALMIGAGRGDGSIDDLAGRVDGLAIVASTVSDEAVERLAARLPVVLLAGGRNELPVDHLAVDNRAGMRAVAEHALRVRGPGAVLVLAGPIDSPDAEERRQGVRDALAAHGARLDAQHDDGLFTRDRGRERTAEALAGGPLGAVIAANDQLALGALDALLDAGAAVPEQCVVTGFDGIEEARLARPPLTTVAQPMEALGRTAIRTLLARIAEPQRARSDERMPVTVVLRESCPPA